MISTASPTWSPLTPSRFENAISSSDGCQYAKDQAYMEAVLKFWKQSWDPTDSAANDYSLETSSWVYHDDDQTPLYGHIVRRATGPQYSDRTDEVGASVPGILLFHTAAGPQDVFLFQAAARLASTLECVVLICDLLSDRDGWAWTDRVRYLQVRQDLARDDFRLLRSRVLAAVHAICPNDRAPQGQEILGVDRRRLAALGWCLGGQPLLELARMTIATDGSLESSTGCYVRSMASFHGVYHRDDLPSPPTQASPDASAQIPQPEVLICNGQADPFVSVDDLTATKMAMNAKGCNVTIVQYDGARHGFSNPAQAFNENDAFDFNENAAKDSWMLTVDLLRRNLIL